MNKKVLYWSLQIGGWFAFALIQILFRLFTQGGLDLFFTLEALILLLVTHFFRIVLKKLRWLEFSMVKLIPRIIGSSIMLGILIYWLRMIIAVPLGFFQADVAFDLITIVTISTIFSFIIFIWFLIYFSYHYFVNYNNSIKQEAAMREIELNNLKSQLNPHFIFNALNSIRALVDENPKKSKNAITQLSGILRNSLQSDKRGLTPFNQELETLKDYLGLESMRYEERLNIELNIDPKSAKFNIPPLMLQTLVENGIKHGIAKLKKGGLLSITTKVKNQRLNIQVTNSGFYNPERGGTGLGILNTQKRLNLIYGDLATFHIKNSENKVLTVLNLPKREEL